LHRCDVRNCVRPDHLWLGSQGDNIQDAIAKGRFVSVKGRTGEDHHRRVLNVEQVAKIKRLHLDGYSDTAIAKLLGVSRSAARGIRCAGTWPNVEPWPEPVGSSFPDFRRRF
jgi:hypothetical protein